MLYAHTFKLPLTQSRENPCRLERLDRRAKRQPWEVLTVEGAPFEAWAFAQFLKRAT